MSDKRGLERFESVQPEYNLGKRDIEGELFAACDDQGVGIIPYQVFMGGVLTGRYDSSRRASGRQPHGIPARPASQRHLLERAYFRHGRDAQDESQRSLEVSVPQLLIAWTLSRPQITSVIVGASRPDQVESNAEATSIDLPATVVSQLDAL